jgi:D-serine dehydratase
MATDANEMIAELGSVVLDHRFKGVPLDQRLPLAELGQRKWNVARGDLSLPVTTLSAAALDHNIATMAEYCARHGMLLAPHGKTTMAPQLFHRQLAAGAWAMTAATPGQVRTMRRYGVPRVLLANQLVERVALRWVGRELEQDPEFDFLCLVDGPAAVRVMDDALDGVLDTRELSVLVEVGVPGGRTGTRTADQALALAQAVAASRHLRVAGVEAYEGLAARGADPEELDAVDTVLDRVKALAVELVAQGLADADGLIITAGGSIYFDRVVVRLGDWSGTGITPRTVLRSGCYISHDAGQYRRLSPLDERRTTEEPLALRNALESWAVVLSRPEPDLVLLGAGKRDLAYDVEMPMPARLHRAGGEVLDLRDTASVTKLMDQHAFMTVDPRLDVAPGDIVALHVSHPCAAFDKAPLLPIVDDEHTVVDGILTFF